MTDRSHPPRILLYSHDSFGLGHFRRSVTIAAAIAAADPDVSILCLTGSPATNLFRLPPRCDLIKMPCLTKDEIGGYASRYLPSSLSRITSLRSELILATLRAYDPDVLLVDHTPGGPGDELVPALRRIKVDRPKTQVILGLRDIIDSPDRAKAQLCSTGSLNLLRRDYNHIMVYGDPKVLDVCDAYGIPKEIRARSEYVGIVCPQPTPKPSNHRDTSSIKILVTAGGGEDGYDLLSAVAAAHLGALRDLRVTTTFVTGPLMRPKEIEALRVATRLDRRLKVQKTSKSMRHLLTDADLVISMGGYNSIYEALSQDCRLLVFPRTRPRLEQSVRSRCLQGLGLLSTIDKECIGDPSLLAVAIREALASPKPDPRALGLKFNGARVAAEKLLALCHPGQRSRASDEAAKA